MFFVFVFLFFFFNDTATTEIYTLSLHDALPISTAVDHAWSEHVRHSGAPDRARGMGRSIRHCIEPDADGTTRWRAYSLLLRRRLSQDTHQNLCCCLIAAWIFLFVELGFLGSAYFFLWNETPASI